MVECQPSKLDARVQFSLSAPREDCLAARDNMGMSITENAGVGAGDKRLYRGAPSAEGVQASNRAQRGS